MKMPSVCLMLSKQRGYFQEQMTTSSEKNASVKVLGLGGGGLGVLDGSIRGGEDKIHTKSMAALVFLFVD